MGRLSGVLYMQTKVAFRNWWVYISVSLLPASYYLVFYLLGGTVLSEHVLFGSLIALALNMGVVSLPQFLVLAKNRKLQEMMVASPIRPFEYMLGFALSRLLFSIPGLVALFALLAAMQSLRLAMLPAVCVIILVTWLVGSMIGFTLGTYIPSLSTVGSVANLVGFLLMLIPPVLYPSSLLSEGWRVVGLLLPSSSAAFLLRHVVGLEPAAGGQLWFTSGVLIVYLIGCALLVTARSRWREP